MKTYIETISGSLEHRYSPLSYFLAKTNKYFPDTLSPSAPADERTFYFPKSWINIDFGKLINFDILRIELNDETIG